MKKIKNIRKFFRFKIDGCVCFIYFKYLFFCEYDESWMGEIFNIFQRVLCGGLFVYRVKDFDDDKIKGIVY